MMVSSRLVVLFLSALASVGVEGLVEEANLDCPTVNHYVALQHMDTACDRVSQNQYKKSLDRHGTYRRLQQAGTQNVPDQQTVFCPLMVEPLTSDKSMEGFDTTWIVENTAASPVVVSYMMTQPDGSIAEVSAFDHTVSPANFDPKAILKPGEWKSIMAHEGNEFHVREVLKDGSTGMVLMQHRVGMVPITNKYGHDLHCDPTELDIEPVIVNQDGTNRDPDYARRMAPELRLCNVIDVGFRNGVGCPVNGYYTGYYLSKGLVKPRGNVTKWKQELANKPKSCHERFEFHLGMNHHPKDFMWDWSSNTKYESAYTGQNFVFRLAKDERVVVDSFSLQTTKVIDCPGLKKQVNAISLPYAQAVLDTIGQRSHLRHIFSTNETSTRNVTNTWLSPSISTSTRRAIPGILGVSML